MRENELQARLLTEQPKRLPDLRLWRRMVGQAEVRGPGGQGREVHFGIKGQADLYGYWRGGVGMEIELKAATGSMSPEQKRWADFCERWGVKHVVLKARANETAEETIERWLSELTNLRPFACTDHEDCRANPSLGRACFASRA